MSLEAPSPAEAAEAVLHATPARCSAVSLALAAQLASSVPKWLLVALEIFQPALAEVGLARAARLASATFLLWAVRSLAARSRSTRACLWARAACLLRAARRRSCGFSVSCGAATGGCTGSAAQALLQAASAAGDMRAGPLAVLVELLVPGGRAVSAGHALPKAELLVVVAEG